MEKIYRITVNIEQLGVAPVDNIEEGTFSIIIENKDNIEKLIEKIASDLKLL